MKFARAAKKAYKTINVHRINGNNLRIFEYEQFALSKMSQATFCPNIDIMIAFRDENR